MERIKVINDRITCGDKDYGPASAILAYPGEESGLGGREGVITGKATPHAIDLVFAIGDKVAGAEVKLPDDMCGSWYSRRVQRQIRTLRETCDVQVLVLRGGIDMAFWLTAGRVDMKFWEDLTNLQTLGVYILPVPRDGYLPWIASFRRALTTTGVRAIAGDDRTGKDRERKPGWLLRRIPGIGPKRSDELMHMYGSVMGVFRAARTNKVQHQWGPAVQAKILSALEE